MEKSFKAYFVAIFVKIFVWYIQFALIPRISYDTVAYTILREKRSIVAKKPLLE